jgi:hypothetical protein
MHWLFLLLAALAFLVAFTTHSAVVLALSILVALGFSAVWFMGLMAQRMGDTARNEAMIIDPQELRRLREQAEARKSKSSDDVATTLLLSGATATTAATSQVHDGSASGDATTADGGGGD